MAAIKENKAVNKKSSLKEAVKNIRQNSNTQSRMNIRLAPAVKERVVRAAALSGQDLTEFAIATLTEKADLVIERHDHLLLGSDDHEFFLNALSEKKVQKPSTRSRAIAEKYLQGTRKGVRYDLAD